MQLIIIKDSKAVY